MHGYATRSGLIWLERFIFRLISVCMCFSPTLLISEETTVMSPDVNFLKMGRAVFEQSCSVGYCHGKAGRAGRGPRLRGKVWDNNYLIKVIEEGVPYSSMAGWKSRLSGEEIRAVVAYIGTLSKLGTNDPEPPLPSDVTSSDLSTPSPLNSPASQPITDNLPSRENHSSVMTGDPEKGKLLFFDIRDFLFNNWLLVICIYFYYRLCVNFLGQALLLLQDGANGVPQFYDWIFALTDPAELDFGAALKGAGLLHLSGITPALGPAGVELARAAVNAAAEAGVPVCFDGRSWTFAGAVSSGLTIPLASIGAVARHFLSGPTRIR